MPAPEKDARHWRKQGAKPTADKSQSVTHTLIDFLEGHIQSDEAVKRLEETLLGFEPAHDKGK